MKKILIKPNKNGDSRVADHVPTFEEFMDANNSHRADVFNLMKEFSDDIVSRSYDHDYSKVEEPYQSMFYRDMCNAIEGKIDFLDGEWYKLHCEKLERHHLLIYCPEDVNLIDVIEMLCDCVAAGKARSGEVYGVDIPEDILLKAVKNTVEMLKECVVTEDEEENDTD